MRKLLILLFSILVSLSPYAEIDYFCTDLIYTSFNKYTGKYKVTPGLVAGTSYIKFKDEMFLIFGKESVGLSKEITNNSSDKLYQIPIHSGHIRSLNLANAVSVAVYEGLRQLKLT